jgi:hypothetical protein
LIATGSNRQVVVNNCFIWFWIKIHELDEFLNQFLSIIGLWTCISAWSFDRRANAEFVYIQNWRLAFEGAVWG